MNKAITVASLSLTCILGSLIMNASPVSAGETRCLNRRSAYCLRYGDRGAHVYSLIENLRCAGYYNLRNDSWFGSVTDKAVRRFQRDHGLTPDGIAGPRTKRRLQQMCSGHRETPEKTRTSARSSSSIRDFDFKNYTYLLEEGAFGPTGTITLRNGIYDDDSSPYLVEVFLTNILYKDLDRDGKEDAIVTLGSTGGGVGLSSHGYVFLNKKNDVNKVHYFQNFIGIDIFASQVFVCYVSPNNTSTIRNYPNLFDIYKYRINSQGASLIQKSADLNSCN